MDDECLIFLSIWNFGPMTCFANKIYFVVKNSQDCPERSLLLGNCYIQFFLVVYLQKIWQPMCWSSHCRPVESNVRLMMKKGSLILWDDSLHSMISLSKGVC